VTLSGDDSIWADIRLDGATEPNIWPGVDSSEPRTMHEDSHGAPPISKSEASDDNLSVAAALEGCYAAASEKLTLGRLRIILETLARSVATFPEESPSIGDIAQVVRDLGIGELPFATIASLVNSVVPALRSDVLGLLTLKQLEELLCRIKHPR
jgi:hypothetical protein